MRDQDIELIVALVEGHLDDETEARALVESAPEFREEYEAQKAAYEALSSVGAATMSESEMAALHRDVWTALHSESAPTRATPWYYRWAPVAAGLLVVVGLATIIDQSGGGETAAILAGDAAATTMAASGATAQSEADSRASGGESFSPTAGSPGAEQLSQAAIDFYVTEASRLRADDFKGTELRALEDSELNNDLGSCLEEAGLVGYSILEVDGLDRNETPAGVVPFIAAAPEGVDPVKSPIAFVDPETCNLLYQDG